MSSYRLEAYEPSDRGDYVGLLGEAWGHQGLSGDEFDWWFERNPAGSLMSVARANGRVVGVAAHTLLPMILGGEERTASFSVHATTHPSMRGQGIFAGLEEKHEREAAERGVAVVLAFASAPTAPIRSRGVLPSAGRNSSSSPVATAGRPGATIASYRASRRSTSRATTPRRRRAFR